VSAIPDLGPLGRVRPDRLYQLVLIERLHLGLSRRELALRLGCTPLDLEDWSLGRSPEAAVLLIAEQWQRDRLADRIERQK
jgi:hypothetical protein